MDDLLILKAVEFAAHKHKDQRRKDEQASPYINHPVKVALVIAEIGGIRDSEVLAAAVLHDTIEDTDTTPEELEQHFGKKIRGMVEEVSDDPVLPKNMKKQKQVDHAPHLSEGATLVKLGDKICNVIDLIDAPPANWSVERKTEYLEWADKVIKNCRSVNKALETHFSKIVISCRQSLLKQNQKPSN